MSFGRVDCKIKTAGRGQTNSSVDAVGAVEKIEVIVGRQGLMRTIFISHRFTDGYAGLLVGILQDHDLCELDAQPRWICKFRRSIMR